ncbi:MAG: hypothetical protein MPEBLZ_00784 [Candidatus Methanoperedens nitroreducens]|uniref:Uncharacterized protein n=1 Tax=Candidatus Methanoperedens nitratireducens TaxID=1392998 RepID=A0A0P8CMG6_9EURY|nr:hypothetical protein [Candidatus Methanoperedens sp. BLZ2]KAB2941718.1 MAG: hypothetical protein F9K14_18150 [Candidatus Methanoperedens sp.]KPQ44627.1 MAG: hypothetical protein MPEBLZ_00784 [Candidatus Methanoperedens sp. BLZ1]MBZ0174784.1 hypothetical protein [Candidatus Methanoperedens nitroreducens]CAG0968202.1 hypothetical protein METP2_01230 [Methanosarcinales archaeon]MCX9087667.1 hypothetical protein [Candidatus Methanoperedens sp.]
MFDVETFKRLYPDIIPQSPQSIIFGFISGILLFSLLFIIPYLYVRFLEKRLISFLDYRLIPFIKFRLRLKKLIDLFHRVLEFQIFGDRRSGI